MLREHHGLKLLNIVNMIQYVSTCRGILAHSNWLSAIVDSGCWMGVKYHTQMNGSWYDPKEIATLGYDMNNTTHQYIISFPKVWIKVLDQIISKGPGPYNF